MYVCLLHSGPSLNMTRTVDHLASLFLAFPILIILFLRVWILCVSFIPIAPSDGPGAFVIENL